MEDILRFLILLKSDLKCLVIQIEKINKSNDWMSIGSGQFGQVFKGIYAQNDENKLVVAIKVI